jgi:dihydroorotate dehydrogenase electron transfer subunit
LSRLFKAAVTDNRQLIKNHYLLTLQPLKKIKKPRPGNFFMLSVDNGLDPLLKRPFSIYRSASGELQFIYRIVGKGTNILSKRKAGDALEVIGPLGNNFPVKKTQKNVVLIAGGLGIAPIFSLAETVAPPPPKKRKDTSPLLFYGARTKKEVLCTDELKRTGIDPIISTDDGTIGKKGNIVNVLKKFIAHNSSHITRYSFYACGPEPMLKALSPLAEKYKLNIHVALEQNMACGLGTCLGCVVKTRTGYKRVCKEGPVFPIEEIVW